MAAKAYFVRYSVVYQLHGFCDLYDGGPAGRAYLECVVLAGAAICNAQRHGEKLFARR